MKTKQFYTLPLAVLAGLTVSSSSVFGQSIPIDLNTWNQESFPASGVWDVSSDGTSVFQSINGAPTFFVSPDNIINASFNGKFQVETTGDDDFIGFVFGYQSPLSINGDSNNDFNFFLFDWKQGQQTVGSFTAQEGFTLSKVDGVPVNNSGDPATSSQLASGNLPWWNHTDPSQTVLDTSYGSTRGWEDNTEYEFDLLYQTNQIKIDIQGGTGDFVTKQTVFELTPDEVGLTSFETGKFGFYNYSQPNVRYQGFTQTPTASTPEPVTILGLLSFSILGLSLKRKK